MFFKLAIIFLIEMINCQTAVLTASLNQTQFLNALKPMLYSSMMFSLNRTQVDNMTYEDGYFNDNEFNILESQPVTTFKDVSDSGALKVTVSGIVAQFYSDMYQFNHKIYVANGTFSIEMSNITISYTIDILQNDVKDKTMPLFEISDLKIDIPKNKMAYVVHSNLVQELIEQLQATFLENFYQDFITNLTQSVQKNFPKRLNQVLQNQNGSTQIYSNVLFDWNVVKFPKMQNNDNWINVGFNGQIQIKNETLEEVSSKIDLPYQTSPSKQDLHIFVANELWQSTLKTNYKINPVRVSLQPSSLVTASKKKQFDTTTLNGEFPGITKKYGANLPLDILIENLTISNVAIIAKNQFNANLAYNLKFQVNPKEAAASLKVNLKSTFAMSIVDEFVTINMKNLTIDSVEVISSSSGSSNVTLITSLLTNLNPLVMKQMNDRNDKLPLPQMFSGILNVKSIVLESADGYLHFSLDTAFVMPTADVPCIGYEQWVPTPKINSFKSEIYEEELDQRGKHSQVIIRNYNFFELLRNQINIFRHIPQLFK